MVVGAPVTRATLSAEGHLLSADVPLAQLNESAGGAFGAPCALPALLELATLTGRLRMRLSRLMILADATQEVTAWAESRWMQGRVEVALTDWAERPRPLQRYHSPARQRILGYPGEHAQCDSQLRIVTLRGWSGTVEDFIGRPLTVWAALEPEPDGALPLIAAVSERQPFRNQRATLPGGDRRLLSGRPLLSPSGIFAGYLLEACEASEQTGTVQLHPGRELGPAVRQSLGAIIANAETIGAALRGPVVETYAAYARDIASAARHLLEVVDDLGDLEAIDRPDFRPATDAVDLAECARLAVGLLRVRAAERQIRLVGPAESVRAPAKAEFRRVLQILVNLIGNAIRYAPDGSEVRLEASSRSDEPQELTVSDEGPGIPSEDQERVFEKFERLGRTGEGGSGLGLYISRRLARAMGGDLSVGARPGGGACFMLTLPSGRYEDEPRSPTGT